MQCFCGEILLPEPRQITQILQDKQQATAPIMSRWYILSERNKIPRRPLPLGYQSCSDLRQDGCYHVDKTPLIRQMIDEGRYYSFSSPVLRQESAGQYPAGTVRGQ